MSTHAHRQNAEAPSPPYMSLERDQGGAITRTRFRASREFRGFAFRARDPHQLAPQSSLQALPSTDHRPTTDRPPTAWTYAQMHPEPLPRWPEPRGSRGFSQVAAALPRTSRSPYPCSLPRPAPLPVYVACACGIADRERAPAGARACGRASWAARAAQCSRLEHGQ